MKQPIKNSCIICRLPGLNETDFGSFKGFSCCRCGNYCIVTHPSDGFCHSISDQLGHDSPSDLHRRGRLSHIVRRGQTNGRYYAISCFGLTKIRLDDPLPNPFEQQSNLISWTGDNQQSPNESTTVDIHAISAWIGCAIDRFATPNNFNWLRDQI
ncbi:MAG: hypothetical protein P4L87_24090 [Formivibrio sp.]|nr:hypothetical protein [Formivibrio sp.]